MKLRLHDTCYCGSGQSYKRCHNGKHFECYKDFRKVEIETLQNDYVVFANYWNIN
ncbi:SEC-C metal-binding domain-containing protein [Maribellus comscasis]